MHRPKTLLLFFTVLAATGLASNPISAQQRAANQFTGTWHLISLEQPGPDGQLHPIDCSGLFIFTADGHLSVQVMDRNPPPQSPTTPQQNSQAQYSQGGYEASYGTYVVDEKTHTFTFHVEGALVRALIGKDLPRRYQFSGNRLIIQSTHPDEHWRVVWQRY